MVNVARHYLGQFRFVSSPGLGNRFAPEARYILHYQYAELVQPVELARLLRLYMYAHHIQAQPLEPPCLVAHRLIRRIREMALRIERLIERAVQVYRLTVEQYPLVSASIIVDRRDLAYSKVSADLIAAKAQRALIKIWRIGRPELWRLNAQRQLGHAALHCRRPTPSVKACAHFAAIGRFSHDGQVYCAIDARRHAPVAYILLRTLLQPTPSARCPVCRHSPACHRAGSHGGSPRRALQLCFRLHATGRLSQVQNTSIRPDARPRARRLCTRRHGSRLRQSI